MRISIWLSVLVAALMIGCNSGSDTTETASNAKGKNNAKDQPKKKEKEASPRETVEAFLGALRSGDEEVAANLLTDRAREETDKINLAVKPPGTPNAAYKVSSVDYPEDIPDGAYVKSIWKETDESGGTETYNVIWVLRKQDEGWRIAGMATPIVPDGEPLFLNFEEPAEMLEKWRRAEEELDEQQARAAGRPKSNDLR